ncbi:unnamed protein product [Didymodactylos carnosus]|uniref:Adenylate kinase n=1 Tax=Didymodactylos carnosus TaxID=1234261 RepID=A0A8S2Z467_9BILA|nr:unnamed protein product [Didymodactylos carnosus]
MGDGKITIQRCLERGKSSGRSDDNAESLKKRIRTYNESTRPIIDMYTKQNLVKTIDASRDVETVFKDVQKLFDEFYQQH